MGLTLKVLFVCNEDVRLGVEYLSAYLKRSGHETELVFDPNLFSQTRLLSNVFSIRAYNIDRIKRINPGLIAFSVSTADYQWALSMADSIKAEVNVPIIFGGIHPTLVPDVVIKNKSVDMVCVGDGEEALLELVNLLEKGEISYNVKNIWFKNDGVIVKNDMRQLMDLDNLPFPDRELFYREFPKSSPIRKYSSFMMSRGCPFMCSYCANSHKRELSLGKGKWIRRMSVDDSIAHLKLMKKNYGTKYFFFFDDILTLDLAWFKDFVKKYKSEVNVPFSCFSHPQLFTQEIANLLKSAGCSLLMLGLQSGCEDVRRNILTRFESNEDVLNAARFCKKTKLSFSIDHIINLPFEKDEDLIFSLNLYNQIRPNVINVYALLFFPKTEIINIAKKAGILDDTSEELINEGKHGLHCVFMVIPHESQFTMHYRKYALLFAILPLLPQNFAKVAINNGRLRSFFSMLPISLVSPIKIMVNGKIRLNFRYGAILSIQLSWIFRILKLKLRPFRRLRANVDDST